MTDLRGCWLWKRFNGRRRARRRGVILLVGPQRDRAADDRGEGEWAKVAAVEAVRDGRVHEEDFTRAKRPTAAPNGKRTFQMIADAGIADSGAIDGHGAADAADRLSREGHHVLQKQHAPGQEAAIGKVCRDRFWRRDRDHVPEIKLFNRTQGVEPERCARGCVPYQPRGRMDENQAAGR
jgi:hypothetical protein